MAATEFSAGGVVVNPDREIVVIVPTRRAADGSRVLALPKGHPDGSESPVEAALREVREEAGVECELLAPIDTAEYWYYGGARYGGGRVRFHKFVHFYLLRYLSGDVADHDSEVNEARWFEIGDALAALAFKSERQIAERARELIEGIITNDER